MKRVVLAGLLAIAAAPPTAQAAPPQLLSPPDGAVLPSTADIPFTARAERFSAPMVVIANRPDLNPEGRLALAFTVTATVMPPIDASETLFQAVLPRPARFPPGTYYWQVIGIGLTGHSPVHSFTLLPATARPGFQCERAQNQLRRQRSALARHNRAHRRRPTAGTKRRIARAREQVRRYQRQVARFC